MENMKIAGSKLKTLVLSSVIIGSRTNPDFRMGLLSTQAGNFQVNSNESPEAVDNISLLREGDLVDIEMFEPIHPTSYKNEAGEDIHQAACGKFKLLNVEGGTPTIMTGVEGRKPKLPIMKRQASTPTTAGDSLAEKDQEEERG